jgi:hypothetical protein
VTSGDAPSTFWKKSVLRNEVPTRMPVTPSITVALEMSERSRHTDGAMRGWSARRSIAANAPSSAAAATSRPVVRVDVQPWAAAPWTA